MNEIKELEKLLKLCRKQGVHEITFDGVSIKFGEMPVKSSSQSNADEIETDELSPDELLYYAVENAV